MTINLKDTIRALYSERPVPVDKIIAEMAKASRMAYSNEIEGVLYAAKLDDVYDQLIAWPALALLPAWGVEGLRNLSLFATNGPHESAALAVLAAISLGKIPTSQDLLFLRGDWDSLEKYKFDPELAIEGIRCLREVVLDHLTDPYRKSCLLRAISS